jgi:hypothetical protein
VEGWEGRRGESSRGGVWIPLGLPVAAEDPARGDEGMGTRPDAGAGAAAGLGCRVSGVGG